MTTQVYVIDQSLLKIGRHGTRGTTMVQHHHIVTSIHTVLHRLLDSLALHMATKNISPAPTKLLLLRSIIIMLVDTKQTMIL